MQLALKFFKPTALYRTFQWKKKYLRWRVSLPLASQRYVQRVTPKLSPCGSRQRRRERELHRCRPVGRRAEGVVRQGRRRRGKARRFAWQGLGMETRGLHQRYIGWRETNQFWHGLLWKGNSLPHVGWRNVHWLRWRCEVHGEPGGVHRPRRRRGGDRELRPIHRVGTRVGEVHSQEAAAGVLLVRVASHVHNFWGVPEFSKFAAMFVYTGSIALLKINYLWRTWHTTQTERLMSELSADLPFPSCFVGQWTFYNFLEFSVFWFETVLENFSMHFAEIIYMIPNWFNCVLL